MLYHNILMQDLIPHQEDAETAEDAVSGAIGVVKWHSAHCPQDNVMEPEDVEPFLLWAQENWDSLVAEVAEQNSLPLW